VNHYSTCPSCHSDAIRNALVATDYTVSHERFEIWQCEACSLRFTQDGPDASNIGRYYRSEDYISHTNTNKGLINRLYLLARNQTLADKYRLILSATRIQQGKLLDIGAGTGAFVAHMKQHGWEVTGLEPDAAAREKAGSVNRVQLLDTSSLYSLPQDSFDAITLWHVLEHVHDLHPYMEQLKKLIKRGGRIFIALPNYTSYDAKVYGDGWAAYDVPRHLYHFSPESIDRLLELHDLQLQFSRPMWYDSLYISMLSEKYKKGEGSVIKGMLTGLLSNAKAFIDKSKCSSLTYIVGK
jgi:SAM-dependent methyltransferase